MASVSVHNLRYVTIRDKYIIRHFHSNAQFEYDERHTTRLIHGWAGGSEQNKHKRSNYTAAYENNKEHVFIHKTINKLVFFNLFEFKLYIILYNYIKSKVM